MILASDPLAHHLPWYFGLAVVAVWMAIMVAIAILVARRWQARRAHREELRQPRHVRPDRALGPGTDIEPW